MNKTILLLSVIIVSILAWTLYEKLVKKEGDQIHVAFIGPLSGADIAAGKLMSQSVQHYFDSVNEKGGINGKTLTLDLFDDQDDCSGKANKAKAEATRIVQENKAVAVIGHWYSGCSITGGEVYKRYAIPAITPGSVSIKVTEGNEWYFRSIFTAKTTGQFLANYIKKVFHQNNVTIIRETAAYGYYLAQIFEETARKLEMTVKNNWTYDPKDKNLEDTFKSYVAQLKQQSKEESGTLFLAMQATEAAKLVRLIKDANLPNLIIGETSFSEQGFLDGLKDLPREKATPGFYTNDIYVATPLIFDTANELAQKFKGEYESKYQGKPDWSAAFAYDTAMVLVKAIKETGVTGEQEKLTTDRQKIRDYLATKITDIHDAIEGTTGFNYFDENRDAIRAVVVGVYKNKTIVSALTQLQQIRNLNEISDLKDALDKERVLEIDKKYMYKTNVVYVGIKFNDISNFNPTLLTCQLDFHIWFRFQGGFNPQEIEFLNAVDSSKKLGEPVIDRIKDQITYRVYKVKQDFKIDFDGNFAYKQHRLGVAFRHHELTRNNLIYVTDELGMGNIQEAALVKRMMDDQVLNQTSGWTINNARFFQDVARKSSLGDPDYLNVQGGTVEYSLFKALVQIKKGELTLRGLLAYSYAYNVLILSVIAILLLGIASISAKFKSFSKLIWLFQTIFAFGFLLASEIVLVDKLAENQTNTYFLSVIIRGFDILWWMTPAFFLNLASERFIWTPLQIKTGRPIPNIVRIFLGFIIYFLALVGVTAFVFEQALTSILATSGVIAMIIGLAIQINISNIFSGIAINIERPFRIGDWVQIGHFDEGEVTDITWRSTRLKTRAECMLSIPNSIASESAIVNYSYLPKFWLWPTVYVHPMHPPDRVKKILLDALLSADKILKAPAPMVIFTGINEWAASYWVVFCSNDYANKFTILEDVWTRIWFHLNRAGIAPAVQRQEIYWFKGIKERGDEEATKPITLLQELDLFKPFSEEAKKYLSDKMRRLRFPTNETVVKEGDAGDSLFIIVEGTVSIRKKLEDGTNKEVARLGVGSFFGEKALMTGEQRTATIVAIAETVLYEITRADIAPLIAKQPEVSERISQVLTQRELATKSRMHKQQVPEIVKQDMFTDFLGKIRKHLG
jgi:branched-chain amino acid transport system substrate-binding protein